MSSLGCHPGLCTPFVGLCTPYVGLCTPCVGLTLVTLAATSRGCHTDHVCPPPGDALGAHPNLGLRGGEGGTLIWGCRVGAGLSLGLKDGGAPSFRGAGWEYIPVWGGTAWGYSPYLGVQHGGTSPFGGTPLFGGTGWGCTPYLGVQDGGAPPICGYHPFLGVQVMGISQDKDTGVLSPHRFHPVPPILCPPS